PHWREMGPRSDPPLGWFRLLPARVHYEYRSLYADPVVGEEAMIRNANYYREQGDVAGDDAALPAARATVRDPYLRYVVLFMTGLFHEMHDRDAEALPFYREANELVPTGRSAALALSSLLSAAGQVTEAEAVLNRAVRS